MKENKKNVCLLFQAQVKSSKVYKYEKFTKVHDFV